MSDQATLVNNQVRDAAQQLCDGLDDHFHGMLPKAIDGLLGQLLAALVCKFESDLQEETSASQAIRVLANDKLELERQHQLLWEDAVALALKARAAGISFKPLRLGVKESSRNHHDAGSQN